MLEIKKNDINTEEVNTEETAVEAKVDMTKVKKGLKIAGVVLGSIGALALAYFAGTKAGGDSDVVDVVVDTVTDVTDFVDVDDE